MSKHKARNIVVIALMAILAIMFFLVWSFTNYGKYRTGNIQIVEYDSIQISSEGYQQLLSELCLDNGICPRFVFLRYLGGHTVSLTQKDLAVMYIYGSGLKYSNETRTNLEEMGKISIKYDTRTSVFQISGSQKYVK